MGRRRRKRGRRRREGVDEKREKEKLTKERVGRIQNAIREGFCVRDMFPEYGVQVREFLRTVNGEKMGMVVKEVISSEEEEEEDEGEGE